MILNQSDGLNLSVVLIFAENILLDQVLQKKPTSKLVWTCYDLPSSWNFKHLSALIGYGGSCDGFDQSDGSVLRRALALITHWYKDPFMLDQDPSSKGQLFTDICGLNRNDDVT